MRAIPSAITGHCCPCGARRHESSKRCRKCSARSRWYRRRAWRTSKTSIRYRIGKSGATGSGKSGGLNELLANLAACADVLIWAIDLKRSVELRTWAPCIDRLATTPDQATALLADAGTIVFARAQHLADHGKREWHPSPAMSSLVIIIDEYAELADDAPDAMSHTDTIARLGRELAVTLIAATQRPTQKVMGQGAVRSQMNIRISYRVEEQRDVGRLGAERLLHVAVRLPHHARAVVRLLDHPHRHLIVEAGPGIVAAGQ